MDITPDTDITEDGIIRIIFEKTDGTNNYRDALYYPQSLYATLTEADIEAEKQKRFDNWLLIIQGTPEV